MRLQIPIAKDAVWKTKKSKRAKKVSF
jgi:hypothetical protein